MDFKKQDPSICCLQETQVTCRDTQRLKIKGRKVIFQAQKWKQRTG